MAYISFSPWVAEGAVATPASEEVYRFSSLELRVIAHAERNDATREIPHGSRLGRFLERVFGMKLGRPLADPHLESLRRFASLARHHPDDVAENDLHHLVDAGYSLGQAFGLLAYLSGRHGQAGALRHA